MIQQLTAWLCKQNHLANKGLSAFHFSPKLKSETLKNLSETLKNKQRERGVTVALTKSVILYKIRTAISITFSTKKGSGSIPDVSIR